QLDALPRRELHDRLLPGPRAAAVKAAALRFRAHLGGPHRGDAHPKDLLDRARDLGLVRAIVDPERVLAVGHQRVALLGDDRFDYHRARVHQSPGSSSFVVRLSSLEALTSAARDSSTFSASREMTSDWWPMMSATPTPVESMTAIPGMLRKLFTAPSSSASSTTSVGRRAPHLSSPAAACFVAGSEKPAPSTT